MLTKIVVTLLVIAGALLYVRKPAQPSKSQSTVSLGKQMVFRYVIYGLIALSMIGSGGYWYWNWNDGNQIVHVTIVSPLVENSAVYLVRKRDISNNEITTVDGINVRLSNQERVVIAKSSQ